MIYGYIVRIKVLGRCKIRLEVVLGRVKDILQSVLETIYSYGEVRMDLTTIRTYTYIIHLLIFGKLWK